jgi:hypothetical protein
MHQAIAAVGFADKSVKHSLSDLEIGYHAIAQRLYRHDVAGSTAKHLLGFGTDSFDFARMPVQRDDGRLVDNNSFVSGVNQSVGRAEINGEVRRDKAK